MIPNKNDELYKYKINWDLINKYELKRKRIKIFIQKKLLDYFDEVDSFTKFILEKLGALSPYELQEKIKYVLEENTEVSIYHLLYNHLINLFLQEFMVDLWKNIIFESLLVKKMIDYYEEMKEKKKKEKMKGNEENENAEIKK